MKKKYTKILAAAALVAVLAVSSVAAGRLLMIESSSRVDDFRALPDAAWVEETIGAAPKLVNEFSNGYAFDRGSIVKNETTSEGRSVGQAYTTLDLDYRKGDERVSLELCGVSRSPEPGAELIERDGLRLYYSRYTHKLVPVDYQVTVADEQAMASGEIALAYGADREELREFQDLFWERDGVCYLLYGHDMALNRDDLTGMACELMAG